MQPTPYTPTTDFSEQEALSASGRSTVNTAALDAEFAAIEQTLDEALVNLEQIQRDDGKLADMAVEVHTLSHHVLNLIGGFVVRGAWVTATAYSVNDIVDNAGSLYLCTTAHTSPGAFAESPNWARFGYSDFEDAATASAAAALSASAADTAKTAAQAAQVGAEAAGAAAAVSAAAAAASATAAQTGTTGFATAGGSANAITAVYVPAITALQNGMILTVRAAAANTTTTPTFSPNGLTAKTIVKNNGQPLVAGEIAGDGHGLRLRWDATLDKWELLNPAVIPVVRITYLQVRQTALSGAVDPNGYAAFLTTGSGLRPGLDASPTPLALAFAAGFDQYGAVDYASLISADASDPLGADLPVNNLSFLHATYSSPTAVTWGATLNPPQYGYAFDKTKQALLRFAGTDASTTILDDYGNTWTAAGNAQIDTGVQINGLNTLLCDGTGDYAESTNFTTLGDGSWTMEFKLRFNALPGAGTNQGFLGALNAGNYGAPLALNNTAGTYKLVAYWSSNGSSNDIANGTFGTKTSWATGTTYHIAFSYDAVAGKYYVYVDGVKDIEVSSTAKICALTKLRLGDAGAVVASNLLNGAIAGFRFLPYCKYPNGTTFTAPDISTFAVEGHWFSLPEMKMYEVTSASASAGTNPGMTARNRVFVGEATTGAATVASVVSYAYRGEYEALNAAPLPGVSTRTTFSHNLGVKNYESAPFVECVTAHSASGYVPGDRITRLSGDNGTYQVAFGGESLRNSATVATPNGNAFNVITKGGGSNVPLTAANFRLGLRVRRAF